MCSFGLSCMYQPNWLHLKLCKDFQKLQDIIKEGLGADCFTWSNLPKVEIAANLEISPF